MDHRVTGSAAHPYRPGSDAEAGDSGQHPACSGDNEETAAATWRHPPDSAQPPPRSPGATGNGHGAELVSYPSGGSRGAGKRPGDSLWQDTSPFAGKPVQDRPRRPLWQDPLHLAGGTARWREDSGFYRFMLARASSSKRQLSILARGGALNLFGLLVSGPMQLALTFVVARGVGPGGTGVFFEAVALFTILSNVGELGADTGLVKFLPQYRALGRGRDLRRIVRTAIWPPAIFCVGLAIAAWLTAPYLAPVLARSAVHAAQVEAYLRTFALFIPLGAVTTVVLAGTRGMGSMAPFVWIQNILLPTLRPVLIAAALALSLSTLAIALGWAAPLVVAFLLGIAVLWKMISRVERDAEPRAGRSKNRRAISAEFWRFARPRALAAVFGITITWLDILLVGAILHSTRQAGIYAAASRVSVLGVSVLTAVGMAIAPQVSELATLGRMNDAKSVFQVGTWWLMALTWPAYISLAIFGPLMLNVFGHGFVAGHTALTILCLAQLFNLGTGNVTIVLLMAGKSLWNMFNAGASLAVNVGLNIFLIPRLGITGAAIAWAAAIVVNNLAAVLEVNYLMKIRPFGRGYWVVAAASVICFGMTGLIVRQIVGLDARGFLLFIVLSSVPYLIVLWSMRGLLGFSAFRGAISRRQLAEAGR